MGGLGERSVTGENRESERAARLRLSRLAEPGDRQLGQLVRKFGAPTVVDRIGARDTSVPGVDNYLTRWDEPVADLDGLAAIDGRFIIPGDSEWPTQLDALDDTVPWGLFVRGCDLRLSVLRSVAIVGARAATQYGLHVASELASDLADRRWTVVSGGAYGIDAAAHRGALNCGGSTVAVLACGVDVSYPKGNASLFERIPTQGGCLVAELPPGTHPTKPRFLQRNRLIAGLTRATVVVEAADRSGALNTAAFCRQLGRQLLAVPGPVTSAMSAGCHRLLRDDDPARLVTAADEIVEEVGPIGSLAMLPMIVDSVRDGLDPTSLRVLEAVPSLVAGGLADIVRDAGVERRLVAGIILRLVAAGLVQQVGDDGFRLIHGAGDRPGSP
ncbi:MAG TPA: DNA-processing protein DprA [Actinomycetes bacterium]|nr:DNA-processing protein DprA [Actinomycetes bacterium]